MQVAEPLVGGFTLSSIKLVVALMQCEVNNLGRKVGCVGYFASKGTVAPLSRNDDYLVADPACYISYGFSRKKSVVSSVHNRVTHSGAAVAGWIVGDWETRGFNSNVRRAVLPEGRCAKVITRALQLDLVVKPFGRDG